MKRIETWVVNGYPSETCGLLIGTVEGSRTRVEQVTEARNLKVTEADTRYLLDPDDFLKAEQEAGRLDVDVVGIWHSHPDHPPRPSTSDLEAAWPGYSYLILSVTGEGQVPDVRSWRLEGEEFKEEEVIR